MQHPGKEFYERWAEQELEDPEREKILKWKAVNLANLALRSLPLNNIKSICEIGGAEGIVLHTLASILEVKQRVNYELSTHFCQAGQSLYPDIEFINAEFAGGSDIRFDAIILSDIIEHVEDDRSFLAGVSQCCRYALLKIPIEECIASKEWFYRLGGRRKPENSIYGPKHRNGHLRGYTVRSALKALEAQYDILDYQVSDVSYFYPSRFTLLVKQRLGTAPTVGLFGGALLVLGRSKLDGKNI